MPYTVWRRPDGTRFIQIKAKAVKAQAGQGVLLEKVIEIGDADASDVMAGRFRGSVWD